jgi:phosphoribosyl 1,2-cyclic phosphodiesterase
VRVDLCGVRGSIPAPGAPYVRYGGSTSCIALSHDAGEPPSLILDGGTGLRQASELLDGAPFIGTLLLTHLHWDHYQGIPFFEAGNRPDASLEVLVPDQGDGVGAKETLTRGMSPPQFPVRPDELEGDWRFSSLYPGRFEVEGFVVEVREVPHKGGRTFGFRVSDGDATITYIPDHCPTDLGRGPDGWGEYHDEAVALSAASDLLIHDAFLYPDELARDAHLGHAVTEYPIALARLAGARAVSLFHHRPSRTDDALDALADQCRRGAVPVTVAVEGSTVEL